MQLVRNRETDMGKRVSDTEISEIIRTGNRLVFRVKQRMQCLDGGAS